MKLWAPWERLPRAELKVFFIQLGFTSVFYNVSTTEVLTVLAMPPLIPQATFGLCCSLRCVPLRFPFV